MAVVIFRDRAMDLGFAFGVLRIKFAISLGMMCEAMGGEQHS